jgi:hypothetical protein
MGTTEACREAPSGLKPSVALVGTPIEGSIAALVPQLHRVVPQAAETPIGVSRQWSAQRLP